MTFHKATPEPWGGLPVLDESEEILPGDVIRFENGEAKTFVVVRDPTGTQLEALRGSAGPVGPACFTVEGHAPDLAYHKAVWHGEGGGAVRRRRRTTYFRIEGHP
jgi:hypothetical protein